MSFGPYSTRLVPMIAMSEVSDLAILPLTSQLLLGMER